MDNEKEEVDTQTAVENQNSTKKDEGEKTKKQVAKKGENGEIVFKNQDELDGFIKRMYAKGAEKAGQGETTKRSKESQEQEEQGQKEQEHVVPQDYLIAKIALAMAKAGVNTEKAERASRLVNTAEVFVNGIIDKVKLEEEINAVVAEFPELKNTKEEEKEKSGFKFGATQSSSKETLKDNKLIPTKKWNKFNSF